MSGLLETICIRLTNKCNLNCLHCWAFSNKKRLLFLDPFKLLFFIKELKYLGLKHVSLSGGEPTLYPYIEFIIDKLLEENLSITLTTNGVIELNYYNKLFKSTYQFLEKSHFIIRISIDGWRKLHETIRGKETYQKTIDTVKYIYSFLGFVNINTVPLCKPNNDIFSLIEDLKKIEIKEWALITPLPRGSLKQIKKNFSRERTLKVVKQWRKILNTKKNIQKVIIWDYLSHPNGGILLESDGYILMPGITENEDIILGHFTEISIQAIEKAIKQRLRRDPVAYFRYE